MSDTKDNQTDIIEFINSSNTDAPETNQGVISTEDGDVVKLGEDGKD